MNQPFIEVKLESTRLQEMNRESDGVISDPLLSQLHASRQYFLKVTDSSGHMPEKRIPVRGRSGITLARWKITQRRFGKILSAYFYINSAGHNIDTWIHYDLETGQELGMNAGDESDPDPAAHLE